MSDSRLEKFIYAICSMDVSDLPVPLSRIEKLWNCLITGETPDFEPLSRNEKYLMAMLDRYDISNLPAPMSRGEKLLYKIVVGETDLSDVPGYLSRYEELLKYLIENGGISEGDFEYVLYTLNQSMYTLYTTAEKPVKSAILTGQTLIDLKDSFENGTYSGGVNKYESNVRIRSVNKFTEIGTFTFSVNSGYQLFIQGYNSERNEHWGSGWNSTKTLVTTSGDIFGIVIKRNDEAEMSVDEFERIGFTTNLFISGDLVSVKMPVLTTVGKNLLNTGFESGELHWNEGYKIDNATMIRTINPINVNGLNSIYVWSEDLNDCKYIFTYDNNMNFLKRITNHGSQINLDNEVAFIHLRTEGTIKSLDHYQKSVVVSTSPITSYEPYKSNILTVNEPVELRGIGEVQDTLDCLTGEVTQRIGEIVLDGSEDETYNTIETSFKGSSNTIIEFVPSENLVVSLENDYTNAFLSDYNYKQQFDIDWIANSSNVWGIYLGVTDNKTTVRIIVADGTTDAEVRQHLQENPSRIVCKLATPTIKTVDLTVVDQDNQSTELGTFENVTHVSLEAENLIPEVEMEVATHISEELASASPLMDDISTEQQQLNETVNEQSNNVDATMIATTEIFEETL